RSMIDAAQHQKTLLRINALRQFAPECVTQRRRRFFERKLRKSEPFVEGAIEGDESESGEADARAIQGLRRRANGPDQRRAHAAAAMGGIDGKLAQMEEAAERAGDGVAGRRAVLVGDGDPYAVALEQAAQRRDIGKRSIGKRRIAMVAEQAGGAVLDAEQGCVIVGAALADAITHRHGHRRQGRQASKPSTMTISASATVMRIALAA